jgi:hypothetical protein
MDISGATNYWHQQDVNQSTKSSHLKVEFSIEIIFDFLHLVVSCQFPNTISIWWR